MMSSIGETGASQPKTQSDLMNNHSEDFIPIDKRKRNDIPAHGDVKGKTLEWNISKSVTNLVRVTSPIEKVLEQFIANDGAQTFSDSDWLDDIYTRSNRSRFQYCKNSNDVLLYVCAHSRVLRRRVDRA